MIALLFCVFDLAQSLAVTPLYGARGVGGGGAMAGVSISPYSDLRFVGTDMGTLYRSTDAGKRWEPVNQLQVQYDSDLSTASDVGFSANSKIVFFANAGRNPKRSLDAGVKWSSISMALDPEERILYWVGESKDAGHIWCATTAGLLRSIDQGVSWSRIKEIKGPATGTVVLYSNSKALVFHASERAIFISQDAGETFHSWRWVNGSTIRAFAAGSDAQGMTFAYLDSNGGPACSWATNAREASKEQKIKTMKECGFVWVQRGLTGEFKKTRKEGGRFLKMAENDSQTLYVTGGDWVRQYGSKTWVSRDAGSSWKLKFQIYDWDQHPFRPWPKDKLEYSAVGTDIGWDDNVPFGFAINRKNSAEVWSSGHYFLHATRDFGEHWSAPFTQFADSGDRASGKRWKSTGLEVTSAMRMKFNPKVPEVAYVSVADLGGLITEDGGRTFRISKVKYNTNYDYAFDPEHKDVVYAASGDRHDFPLNSNTPWVGQGGIFVSTNRGRTWRRLTPDNTEFNRQFLSVAYDSVHRVLYGGTQGGGVARSKDGGTTWAFFNPGFPQGERLIPQLEIDPKSGEVYALLTGVAPEFSNADETGIYRLRGSHWTLLRGQLERPGQIEAQVKLWQFPSAFAVDWSRPLREVLWLTDIENKGAWLATGAWKTADGGKTWRRATQFTHPTAITLNLKSKPNLVQVTGLYDVTGKWGRGGALSSADGGVRWKKNEQLPLQSNLFNFTSDPNDSSKGFFLFFGGGIYYGAAQSL